jgi:hypothetical protein
MSCAAWAVMRPVVPVTPTSSAPAPAAPMLPLRAVRSMLLASKLRPVSPIASRIEPSAVSLAVWRENTVSTLRSPSSSISMLSEARAVSVAPSRSLRRSGCDWPAFTPSPGT